MHNIDCGDLAAYAAWAAAPCCTPHGLQNSADVHRTSRTSLQFHCSPCGICGEVSAIYIMQQYILQKYTKFRLIHFGTTFHIQHRSIQTKVSTVSHTTTQELLKKSPRGVQRGRGFTAPLRFSTASQSKKTRPSAKQESKNKTKNQPHNKQRKRKSQRKIKKKNKRKNKGEKA